MSTKRNCHSFTLPLQPYQGTEGLLPKALRDALWSLTWRRTPHAEHTPGRMLRALWDPLTGSSRAYIRTSLQRPGPRASSEPEIPPTLQMRQKTMTHSFPSGLVLTSSRFLMPSKISYQTRLGKTTKRENNVYFWYVYQY